MAKKEDFEREGSVGSYSSDPGNSQYFSGEDLTDDDEQVPPSEGEPVLVTRVMCRVQHTKNGQTVGCLRSANDCSNHSRSRELDRRLNCGRYRTKTTAAGSTVGFDPSTLMTEEEYATLLVARKQSDRNSMASISRDLASRQSNA